MTSTAQSLTLARPDDWHLHLRDGDALAGGAHHGRGGIRKLSGTLHGAGGRR